MERYDNWNGNITIIEEKKKKWWPDWKILPKALEPNIRLGRHTEKMLTPFILLSVLSYVHSLYDCSTLPSEVSLSSKTPT